MAIQPCGHLVLVRLDKIEEKTRGGLYVPETVQDTHTKAATSGVILALGPNCWKAFDDGTPWAKVGDRVVFPRYCGVTVDEEYAGEEHCMLCNDADIKGIIV